MTLEQIKEFEDCIIKIKVNKNVELPYEYGTFITYLKYDNTIKHYVLNHPYDIDKKIVVCGEANFDYNDVEFIKNVTLHEATTWYDEYQIFHAEQMKAKGYDNCSIELNTTLK